MNYRKLQAVVGFLAILLLPGGCKEWISPSKPPAKSEVEALVARAESSTRNAKTTPTPIAVTTNRTEITVNMAPRPDHPAETDVLIRELEMFEKANPDIKVHISMWRYTPEDFLDRAQTRTLTDVVEVAASQMPAIIDMSYAVDLSDDILKYPEYTQIQPEAAQLCMKEGRVFGVPIELHTLALFYNRKLFAEAVRAARKAAEPAPEPTPTPAPKNTGRRSRGGGSDGEGITVAYELTQNFPWDARRPADGSAIRARQQQAVEQPQPTPRRGLLSRIFGGPQQRPEQVQEEDNVNPVLLPDTPEDENAAPDINDTNYIPTVSDLESAAPLFGDDLLNVPSTEPGESHLPVTSALDRRDSITSISETYALPQTWDELVQQAAKLTDHALPRYGYAPVCISYEGGREITQWAVQSGVKRIQYKDQDQTKSDLTTSLSVTALQWIRDMTGKYDIAPPIARCYAGNILKMFATGQVAMICLPANRESFERLQRSGMPIDDIGVAKMPAGPNGQQQLVEGTCMIVNTQISPAKRKAALRWIMFQHSPQRIALRARLLANERELVGAPKVPIYLPARQAEMDAAIAPYRLIPLFTDYEKDLLPLLTPQPAWFMKMFYNAVGRDLYGFLDNKSSDVNTVSLQLGRDFMESSLGKSTTSEERLKTQLKDFVDTAEREFKAARKGTRKQ